MRSLWIGMMMTLLALPARAAMDKVQADSLVAQAVRHYSQDEVSTALSLFDSVAVVWNSAALQYNIGNCHYKLGDIGRAILHYERALRLAPGAADVQANLDLARQQVVDRVHELPGLSMGVTWERLRGGRDADQWARRSLWACLAFFLVLSASMLIRQRVAAAFLKGFAAVLGIALLVSIAFASVRRSEVRDATAAIVLVNKVDVRSEPRDAGTKLFVLHKGTKVTVLQEQGGWTEVRLANGNVGWMPPAAAERI